MLIIRGCCRRNCCVMELNRRTSSCNQDVRGRKHQFFLLSSSTNRLCKCLMSQFSEAFCHKVLKAFFGAMWVKDGAGTSGLKYVAEYGLFIACASPAPACHPCLRLAGSNGGCVRLRRDGGAAAER